MRVRTLLPLIVAAMAFLLVSSPAVLPAAEAPASPFSPAIIPSLTPEQAAILQDAVRRGELTPESRQVIRSNPEVRAYLPPRWREMLDAEAALAGEGTDNAAMTKARKEEAGKEDEEKRAEEEKKDIARKSLPQPYDWRTSVYVSRLFLSRLAADEAKRIVHFGHRLFDPRAETPSAADAQPVPDEYVIGPGDEIVVKLWGRVEGVHRLRVDRDGNIFFPKLGSIYVAGKTFAELRPFLRNRVGAFAKVDSVVTLGQLKGLQVSVLGEVPSPGRYQVSSYHTVLQAITMAGGIKDIGSLRRVQVKRGKETVKEVDIYDFLLQGDVSHDIQLRAGEAIFVPVAGPLVAVTGEVRRPAIYELSKERVIADVLAMAGGLSPSAYKRRLQVERLEGNIARVVADLNLEDAERTLAGFALKDGDVLRILAILPGDANVVWVDGNVQRPGKYEWKPGLSVASLIPDETFFLPDTFLDYALVTRLVGPERRKEVIPVNLRKAVIERDAAADVALMPMDNLVVYNQDAFREVPTATVGGEVRKPGVYQVRPGVRISDLVKLGGDLTGNASLGEAELSRLDETKSVVLMKIDLGKALSGDDAHDIPVRDRDILMVRPVPDLQETRYVAIAGEVRSPGVYAARRGERLSSVLKRAGGFTGDAFLSGAVFTRLSVQKRQQEVIDRTVEQLEQEISRSAAREGAAAFDREDVDAAKQVHEARRMLLAKLRQMRAQGRVIVRLSEMPTLEGTEDDLAVEHGDRLEVPRTPEVINVVGRVYNPTGVVYSKTNRTAGYYLRKVGGPTEDADRKNIFVVKADGSVVTSESAGGGLWFFGGDDILRTTIERGDAIVVPEKLVYARVMKDVKDFTQILYQIAVTAGVLIVVF